MERRVFNVGEERSRNECSAELCWLVWRARAPYTPRHGKSSRLSFRGIVKRSGTVRKLLEALLHRDVHFLGFQTAVRCLHFFLFCLCFPRYGGVCEKVRMICGAGFTLSAKGHVVCLCGFQV